MKILNQTGRHAAEVVDENGKRIDHAHGRDAVWKMRQRHDLAEIKPLRKDTTEIPTGFEND